MTRSTLIEDACRRVYLAGGMEASLEAVHRALLKLDQRARRSEVRAQVDLELMTVFFRAWLAANPDLPPSERRAAHASADARLSRAMDAVAETVGRQSSVLGRSQQLVDVLFGPAGLAGLSGLAADADANDATDANPGDNP